MQGLTGSSAKLMVEKSRRKSSGCIVVSKYQFLTSVLTVKLEFSHCFLKEIFFPVVFLFAMYQSKLQANQS